MGRAFLSTAYLPPAPPAAASKLQRWSPQNRFDPDDEHLGGLDMVYEAIVDPLSSAAAATVASIDAVAAATGGERDDDASSSSTDGDGDSDTATALSSPASAGSNEAAQLASLQRRLTAAAARPPNTAGTPTPTSAPAAQTDTARRIQEHVAAISSLFDRVAPPSAGPGRSPRRAATLSSLDILTRPAVAQSI